MINKLLLSLIFFITNTCIAYSQTSNDSLYAKLDEYLNAANSIYKFNGTALIAQHGNIILHKGYGYQNIDAKALNDTNTVFQIASITKEFTATVILKLQEEGKLSIQDKLSKYFPQYKYANDITLENLLTHTSGMYNYTNNIDDEDSALVCNPVDKQIVLDIIFSKPPSFKPGTQFSYCNSGYYLLGLIIEKLTGDSYEAVVRKLIFSPLQMQSSGFNFRQIPISKKAVGYRRLSTTGHIVAQRWDSTVTYSAGGIYSTCNDLFRWANAIAQQQIISAASWQLIFTPHLEHYGYGFYIDSAFGKEYIMHSGGMPGFTSYFMYYPAKGLSIILLNNKGDYGEGLSGVATSLSAIVFHQPYQLITAHKEITMPVDTLKQYVGEYAFDKKHKVIVTLENNLLQMEAPAGGLPKSPLYAESETMFYLKIIDATIEFVKDGSGNIIQLIARYKGKEEVCTKIK